MYIYIYTYHFVKREATADPSVLFERGICFKGTWSLRFLRAVVYNRLLVDKVLVAEWIHFTLWGIILPTIKLTVYTFGGL